MARRVGTGSLMINEDGNHSQHSSSSACEVFDGADGTDGGVSMWKDGLKECGR